jgi:hypothetical protein
LAENAAIFGHVSAPTVAAKVFRQLSCTLVGAFSKFIWTRVIFTVFLIKPNMGFGIRNLSQEKEKFRFSRTSTYRIHTIKPTIDLRLNVYIYSNLAYSGLDLRSLRPYVDSIRSSNYNEQSGDMSQIETKRKWLFSVRRAVGDDNYFLSAIGVRPKATPELIRQGVVVSAECGADGLTIGHYDCAPFSNLRAILEGMKLADVEIVKGK